MGERKRAMKYFLIGMDEENKTPYDINKNRAIDIRMLSKENLNKLPLWNVLEMEMPQECYFPDIICSPCLLLSQRCVSAAAMYQPDILFKGIKLWDKKSGINATYFLTVLDTLDCMSEQTQFNPVGNRVIKLVLDQNKIGSKAIFGIKGFDRKCIVGRMDFVESILRRGAEGITLEEICMNG